MKSITSDTEILINDGWCKIQDYNNKNKIAVLNYDENNSIEFITIDNITTINEDYLYLINSEDFDFSQAIGRNTITNVNLINQQITNIKYNKNDYVICSGFKQFLVLHINLICSLGFSCLYNSKTKLLAEKTLPLYFSCW